MAPKDLEGMRQFYNWLDTHRELIETSPNGYLNTIITTYQADTNNLIKDKWTASRWIRKYRTMHGLKIRRLTQPYVRHNEYRSNYEPRVVIDLQ